MLIPLTRAPSVFSRAAIYTIAPAAAALNAQLPVLKETDKAETSSDINQIRSPAGTVPLNGIERRITRLFAMINTDRIVGPSLLRYVVSRNFSCGSSAAPTALFTPMSEPYGSVIQSLQSRFLQACLFKIHEDEFSVTFSDGTHKLQIITDRNHLPSETGYFIDRHGQSHCIRILQRRFNPEAYFQEIGDLKNILDRYGVEEIDKSQAAKDDGIRDYLSLSFRQMINFMDWNKKALAKL